jgi:hypothetical protein
MPVNAPEKTDYRWQDPGLPIRPGIIAFIGSSDNREVKALLSGLAEALSAEDRRVALVDGAENIGLMSGTDSADFLLVDLPFRPGPFTGSVLSGCDLIIVAGSCKIEYLSEVENIVKTLLFLGIDTGKIAGVVVDPEGILSGESLAGLKPYLESTLGIEIAGAVSFAPGIEPSREIERLARFIMPRLDPAGDSVLSAAR